MTTYYIDVFRGNDSWDGLYPTYIGGTSGPWANPKTKINNTTVSSGDQVLIANDSVYTLPWTNSSINPHSSFVGVTIGAYYPFSQASKELPTFIWNYKIQASDWTYSAPDNSWYYTPPFTINQTCLLKINNTWLPSCVDSTFPLDSVDGRYGIKSGLLYMYAPSTQDPTTYYGEILFSMSAHGVFTIGAGRDIILQDLKFQDTAVGVLTFSTTGASTSVIRRIYADTCSGIFTINGPAGSAVTTEIYDCHITNFGSYGIAVNANGTDGVIKADIHNNYISNGVHNNAQAGIYIQARHSSGKPTCFVHHNFVENARYQTRDKLFDGCGIYTETGSDNAKIYNNTIRNCYLAFQDNSGRSAYFSGNLVYNCHAFIRITDASTVGSTDCHITNNTAINLNTPITPEFETDSRGVGVYCSNLSGAKLEVINNLFTARPSSTKAAVLVPDTPGTSTIDHNWFYGFSNVAAKVSDNGTSTVTPTNSTTTDPSAYLYSNGRLKEKNYTTASPNPIASSGTSLKGSLINGRQGTEIGAFKAVYTKTQAAQRRTRG